MKIQRIWFGCCLLFCICCLSVLIDQQFEVTYLTNEDGDEHFEYVGCLKLSKLPLNRTEIPVRELGEIFIRYLVDWTHLHYRYTPYG